MVVAELGLTAWWLRGWVSAFVGCSCSVVGWSCGVVGCCVNGGRLADDANSGETRAGLMIEVGEDNSSRCCSAPGSE